MSEAGTMENPLQMERGFQDLPGFRKKFGATEPEGNKLPALRFVVNS